MKQYILMLNCKESMMKEFEEHLKMNGYEAFFESDYRYLVVEENEIFEVKTMLYDRNINFTII